MAIMARSLPIRFGRLLGDFMPTCFCADTLRNPVKRKYRIVKRTAGLLL